MRRKRRARSIFELHPAAGVTSAAAEPVPVRLRTVGVDLSAAPARTAAVALEWEGDRVSVGVPALGLDDAALLELLATAGWVAIAAPFGWPQDFVAALGAYERTAAWPRPGKLEFRFRATDRFLHECVLSATGERLWPLSVATDRVAMTAWRLAGLREAAAERSGIRFDRAGSERVVEAHPAASLLLWGLPRGDYKVGEMGAPERREAATTVRAALLEALLERLGVLSWAPGAREACVDSADAFEALVCALVARAAALGFTSPPPPSELARAQAEGWTHLPLPASLTRLL